MSTSSERFAYYLAEWRLKHAAGTTFKPKEKAAKSPFKGVERKEDRDLLVRVSTQMENVVTVLNELKADVKELRGEVHHLTDKVSKKYIQKLD